MRNAVTVFALLLLVVTGCRTSDVGLDAHANSAAFDNDVAVELARLNLYSYQHLTDYENNVDFVLPPGHTLVDELITYEWFSGNTTEVGDLPIPLVVITTTDDDARLDGAITVWFRGSVTPSEWLDDATMVQTFFDEGGAGIRAHNGFVELYRSVRADLLLTLDDLADQHPDVDILFTGHSLGGALATLAALDVVETLDLQPRTYTFASPRVGDEAFRDAFHEKVHTSWRVANINDYVPRYPPSHVVTGRDNVDTQYRHVQAVQEIDFGTWFEPPLLENSGLLEVDFDPSTEENIDFTAIDWDSPSLKTNHGICHHFNYFCSLTDDEDGCRLRADGQDGCNVD